MITANKNSNTRMFKGIIPPLVTPLLDRDTLDREGLARLVEHTIDGGVNAIFILGTTGEAPCLSYRLRREVVSKVSALTKGRLPIIVCITDTSFVESVAIARHAAESGASAVVLTVPYYYPPGQTELVDYVRHIVKEIELPLLLYNIPAMTKVWFELDSIRELSQID